MGKGVGRKSVASDGHTTDAVYSLQAGKTVDISRCASESTDLLSAFSTASATLWPAAAPPTRPAAGRLAAVAAHRATGEDVDAGNIAEGTDYAAYVPYQESGCVAIHCIVTCTIGVILLYGGKTCCFYSAIWEIETIDDSRLTANFASVVCEGRCKASVVGHSLRPTASVQCEGTMRSAAAVSSAYGHQNRLAGVIRLLYAGRAVKEEPQAADAADKGIWYARQSRQKPPQTRINLSPNPREMNGQAPAFEEPSV